MRVELDVAEQLRRLALLQSVVAQLDLAYTSPISRLSLPYISLLQVVVARGAQLDLAVQLALLVRVRVGVRARARARVRVRVSSTTRWPSA